MSILGTHRVGAFIDVPSPGYRVSSGDSCWLRVKSWHASSRRIRKAYRMGVRSIPSTACVLALSQERFLSGPQRAGFGEDGGRAQCEDTGAVSPREILWRILTGSISRAHLREKRLYDGSRPRVEKTAQVLRVDASRHRPGSSRKDHIRQCIRQVQRTHWSSMNRRLDRARGALNIADAVRKQGRARQVRVGDSWSVWGSAV